MNDASAAVVVASTWLGHVLVVVVEAVEKGGEWPPSLLSLGLTSDIR